MADDTSLWEKLGLEAKVTEILAGMSAQGHHFGRPFITAYQLAIAFAERYPDTTEAIGLPIGGAGTGQHTSLAQYLARELSRRIHSGHIERIEGALLSSQDLQDLAFRHGDQVRHASVQSGGYDLSMFRLGEPEGAGKPLLSE